MHPKTERNPRGAGRSIKYSTEEERRAARSERNRRYEAKVRQRGVRVVTYVDAAQVEKLHTIMAREGLRSMAAAFRWMLSNDE